MVYGLAEKKTLETFDPPWIACLQHMFAQWPTYLQYEGYMDDVPQGQSHCFEGGYANITDNSKTPLDSHWHMKSQVSSRCTDELSFLYFSVRLSLDTPFIHGTITVLESLTSCLLALDLFWVLSRPRWQLLVHSIPRRYVIPPQLLWNGAQPQFYFRHLRCVVVLQLYTSDIYVLLQNHSLCLPLQSAVRLSWLTLTYI